MGNRTAFARAPTKRIQIEHNMCGRRAALSPLWRRPSLCTKRYIRSQMRPFKTIRKKTVQRDRKRIQRSTLSHRQRAVSGPHIPSNTGVGIFRGTASHCATRLYHCVPRTILSSLTVVCCSDTAP